MGPTMIDLSNKIVLVTGATGGIGSAIARTVVSTGGKVILHDLNDDDVDRLTSELGDAVSGVAADLRDPAATQSLWDRALAVHGRIDVLVNNAGIYPPNSLDQPLDEWVGVWNISLAVNL